MKNVVASNIGKSVEHKTLEFLLLLLLLFLLWLLLRDTDTQ